MNKVCTGRFPAFSCLQLSPLWAFSFLLCPRGPKVPELKIFSIENERYGFAVEDGCEALLSTESLAPLAIDFLAVILVIPCSWPR